ncbi:MAG: bifunctional 2-polyprenyl-6-hydroxyphenol methylase/3-demethylubiquinol 3-O-methyltransferase UbiG [Woeseiaceae bacterium]
MTEQTLNFDPKEIAKFEELASRWWDPDSEFKPLHEINPLRLEYIDRRSSLKGKTVVDIGCGGGILAESMALKGADVLGIDMGKAPLSVASLHKLESGAELEYEQITAEELAERDAGKYDVVTCMEMLEHVPDPASVIAACSKLVKPDGHVFFSTINRNPKSYLFAIVGAEYIMQMLPKGTHDYSKFIRPSELEEWARAADLNLRELTGMSYNIFSKKYSLGHDVDVNYLMHTQK